jgi:hypothetical protein
LWVAYLRFVLEIEVHGTVRIEIELASLAKRVTVERVLDEEILGVVHG